jgi:sphingomyelin phosphodiesterase 2
LQLHAEYDRQNDEYLAHRVVQAFDTAQFIKLSSYPGEISLVAGDLNTEPNDNAFHVIKHVTGLKDCQDSVNMANIKFKLARMTRQVQSAIW